jgi:hypothetical protein
VLGDNIKTKHQTQKVLPNCAPAPCLCATLSLSCAMQCWVMIWRPSPFMTARESLWASGALGLASLSMYVLVAGSCACATTACFLQGVTDLHRLITHTTSGQTSSLPMLPALHCVALACTVLSAYPNRLLGHELFDACSQPFTYAMSQCST